jgi:hypothetical protein
VCNLGQNKGNDVKSNFQNTLMNEKKMPQYNGCMGCIPEIINTNVQEKKWQQ